MPTLANSRVSGLMSERGITLYIRASLLLSRTWESYTRYFITDTFVIAGTTVSGAAVPMSMGLMEATKCLYSALYPSHRLGVD